MAILILTDIHIHLPLMDTHIHLHLTNMVMPIPSMTTLMKVQPCTYHIYSMFYVLYCSTINANNQCQCSQRDDTTLTENVCVALTKYCHFFNSPYSLQLHQHIILDMTTTLMSIMLHLTHQMFTIILIAMWKQKVIVII